jgi:thiol-disulfide isomerase/thioredoxin
MLQPTPMLPNPSHSIRFGAVNKSRNRFTSSLAALVVGLGLSLTAGQPLAQALQGPQAPTPLPTFELDKKGQRALLDFGIKLNPVSDAKLKFAQYAKRKLMVFYFSAKCPHCLHAAPHVQKLADELAPQGFQSIAVAVKFNSEDDIRTFIRDYRIHMPVFHDDSRQFGENYGTGSIPLVIVANEKGEYLRFKNFDALETPRQVKIEANLFAQK